MQQPPTIRRFGAFLVSEREVVLAFFASRGLIWILGWLAWRSFVHGNYTVRSGPQLWRLLDRWDSGWYRGIVQGGYFYTPGAESSVAFFPLLPLCIRAVCAITRLNATEAGFVVSNLALLAAAILLRRIVALDYPAPERVPVRAVWLLLFCPMSFFYSAMYTESLFLMLSLAAFLAARRGLWLGAGISGALLTATRGNALLILLPLGWEAFEQWRRSEVNSTAARGVMRSPLWLALVPAGLAAYMIFLQVRFGDALAFAHAMRAWGRGIALPWGAIREALEYPLAYRAILLGSLGTGVSLYLLGWRVRLRVSYQLYAGATLALYACTTILHSLPRYLSVIFPFYIALAVATRRSEGSYSLLLAGSACLLALFLALFVCDYLML